LVCLDTEKRLEAAGAMSSALLAWIAL